MRCVSFDTPVSAQHIITATHDNIYVHAKVCMRLPWSSSARPVILDRCDGICTVLYRNGMVEVCEGAQWPCMGGWVLTDRHNLASGVVGCTVPSAIMHSVLCASSSPPAHPNTTVQPPLTPSYVQRVCKLHGVRRYRSGDACQGWTDGHALLMACSVPLTCTHCYSRARAMQRAATCSANKLSNPVRFSGTLKRTQLTIFTR